MAIEAKSPRMMQCNQIDCLSDELLMEILRRLPNCKYVIRCKCVCKRWAALVSHPWFITQFIGLKSGNLKENSIIRDGVPGNSNEKHHTFAIVMLYHPNCCQPWHGPENLFRPSIFNAQSSSFSPLHYLGDDKASAEVVASCNDLLIYCRDENKKYDYYISNVQTRQWVTLPSPSFHYVYQVVGFISDPFYSCEREIVLNYAYSYTIVVIGITLPHVPSKKIRAHFFSSTNHCDSQWSDRVLSLPKASRIRPLDPGFRFNGKLHFTCNEGIFGFDHNSIETDNEIQCHLVGWPVSRVLGSVYVSKGKLQLYEFEENEGVLRVWVLENYKKGIWMLQHRIETSDWVSPHSWMTEKLIQFSSRGPMCIDVFGIHHSDTGVIYVLIPGCVFECNLFTRAVKLACRMPVTTAEGRQHCLMSKIFHPLVLPSWPTPLRSTAVVEG